MSIGTRSHSRITRRLGLLALCLLTAMLLAWTGMAGAESEPETAPDYPVLEVDTETDVIIREGGEVKWFAFTPDKSGIYCFEATGDYDNRAAVYADPAGEPLAENDDRLIVDSSSDESEKANFRLEAALEKDKTYYFAACMCYEDVVGDFSVKLSWLRKAIKSAKVLQEPRLVYYQGYDTTRNVQANGACIEFTFDDDSKEIQNCTTTDNYESYVQISHNAKYEYVSGKYLLKKGKFRMTLAYREWSKSYDAEVISADQIPSLTVGKPETIGISEGHWFHYTAAADGYYLLHAKQQNNSYSSYSLYMNVYDDQGIKLTDTYSNTSSYNNINGWVFRLAANETYLINFGRQSSYGDYYIDNRADLSVETAATMTEAFTEGEGFLIGHYTAETNGVHSFEIGFDPSSGNYSYMSNAPQMVDEEGKPVALFIESPNQTNYPENYRNNCRKYGTEALEAGKTYYLFATASGDWAARICPATETIRKFDLTEGVAQEGELAAGESAQFFFTVNEDAYYHIRQIDSYYWLSPQFSGNYSPMVLNNSHYETTEDGAKHRYIDQVFRGSEGKTVRFSARNTSEDGETRKYHLLVEKLPSITQLEVIKQPDNPTFLRTDRVETSDLQGMELKAVYADGVEETVYAYDSEKYATRTGLQLESSDVTAYYDDNGRLIAGKQYAEVTYLDATTTVEITVVGETPADGLPVLAEGVELTGTIEAPNSSWIQFLIKPEKTGAYRLTGTMTNTTRLYLYNSKGESIPCKGQNWYEEYEVTWALQTGETYLLETKTDYWYDEDQIVDYALTVNLVQEQTETIMTLGNPQSVVIEDGIPVWFTFTPTETARYRFYSTDCAYNPKGTIYQGVTELISDYYSGGGNNFSMTCQLEQGVTYRLMVDSYYSEDSCLATLVKAPVVTSLEIISLPDTTDYLFPYDKTSYDYYLDVGGVSFSGLTIKAQLDGQREETLDYYDTSDETGEEPSTWIQNPEYDSTARYLLPGTYDAIVSYGGLEKTFQVTVRDENEITALEADAEVTTGTWEIQGDMHWTLTVPEDGYYSVTALKASDYYSSSDLYEKGTSNTLSTISSGAKTVTVGDTTYQGYEKLYYLKKGAEYIVRQFSSNSSDRTSYRVQVQQMKKKLAVAQEDTVEADKDRTDSFLLSIEEPGFYRYEYTESSNSENAVPSLTTTLKATGNQHFVKYYGGSGWTSTETGTTVYSRKGNCFFYLSKGQYVLNNSVYTYDYSSTSQTFTYTHQLKRVYPTNWPVDDEVSIDLTENNALVIAVPEGADGTYSFQIASTGTYGSSGNAYLYDADSDDYLASSYLSYKYDQEQEKTIYQGALGAQLEGGKQYLLKINTYNADCTYTVKAQSKLEVVSATITRMPKQRYYSKLEDVTADTVLKNGMQVKFAYSDGTEETLTGYSYSDSGKSSKTGMTFDLTLPEDVVFDASGNLTPGMYTATLTYMDMEPLTVPIEVATVASMPKLNLDESGQGTYSGQVEDPCTNTGFVRFVANEDGFYNLTLSVDTSVYDDEAIEFSELYNSAYKSITINNTSSASTDNRYMTNGSTYVRKGQTCYIKYYQYSDYYYTHTGETDGEYTLTVERATDIQITPLQLNTPVQVESDSGVQWYSFTPEATATYYLNTRDYGRPSSSDLLKLYASPDTSEPLRNSSQINYYVYERQIGYRMTEGKTYYFRVSNSNSNFRLILVKEASSASLELLTDGDIFCSTIVENVNRSFADLLFKVTYNDGTTEELTFGYNHTATPNYSLMGTQIKVSPPAWEKNEDGTIKQDQVKTVRFIMGNATADVTVIPRSIEDLDDLNGTITATVPAHESVYYRFMPAVTGYYRFDASMDTDIPRLTLYNQYMAEEKDLFNNLLNEDDGWHQIRVYRLVTKNSEEEDDIYYCLRLTNNGNQPADITFTAEQLSPVASITVVPESLPQTNYYLGIDRQFTDDGLQALITYEDDTTETIAIANGEGISKNTGLKLQTSLSQTDIIRTLSTDTRKVYLTYMNGQGSYPITVMDSSTIAELKAGQRSDLATLASAQDSAYMKFIPEESGFYAFALATEDEGLQAVIDSVKNSSYTDLTMAAASQNGDEATVYLLEGKTYYLKGHLMNQDQRSGGTYTALVERITDLRDGVQTGTITGLGHALFQFTTSDEAYYQFTQDASAYVTTKVFNTGMSPVNLTEGYKQSADGLRVRWYYAAKLQASSSYLVAVNNNGPETEEFAIFAGLKPAVTGVTIKKEPDKTLYYAFYDRMADVDPAGLTLEITYEDGESEELIYGRRSSWGVSMTLNSSAIKPDANGCLQAGSYPVTATYLDKTAEYTVEVRELDKATLTKVGEDTPIALTAGADESLFFAIEPAADHQYRMYSRDADETLRISLYDQDGVLLQSDVGAPDFSLEADLNAGKTYVARIQATRAGKAFTGTLRLHDNAKSIEVTGVTIQKGDEDKTVTAVYLKDVDETVQLTAVVMPDDAENKNVTWSSSDEATATVTETGLVTLKAKGSATVTVTTADGGYTASCAVVCDDELPSITQYAPQQGTTIGPDYRKLNVLVHDNTGVDGISLRVRNKTKNGAWTKEYWINPVEKEEQDVTIQITLKLKGEDDVYLFNDGDVLEAEMTPVDRSGNRGEAVTTTFVVDRQAPVVSDLTGTYNTETLKVDLSWTVSETPDIDSFAVYKKEKNNAEATWKRAGVITGYSNKTEYTYTDTTIENKDASYQYYVLSYDKYGNEAQTATIDVDTQFLDQKPEVVLNVSSMAVTGKPITVNLTGTKDDIGIKSIAIDFGDGNTTSGDGTELVFTHEYTLAGVNSEKKTLTVTVTDTINQATTETRELTIVNGDQAGILDVTVVDTDGIPVKDAPVYFNLGEDDQEILNTDGTGKVTFIGAGGTDANDRNGFHKVGVLKDNYLPEAQSIKLINGETTAVNFVLEEKAIVEGQFESHRMTLDEIRDAAAAGYIDLGDPESYHTMVYEVTLEYETITFNVCDEKIFDIHAPEGYYPCVLDENVVLVLKVPVGAQILKSFYSVKLYIMNNASSAFSLLNSQVELFVNPEKGMTVLDTMNPALVDLGEIPGQTTKEVEWILRGDKSGKYKVSADFSATLSDFNKPITAHFEGDKELEVRGVDDLEIVMQIPDKFSGTDFFYNLKLSNIAEEDNENTIIYLPQLRGAGQLIQSSWIKQNGTTVVVKDDELPESLKKGEGIQRFYRIPDMVPTEYEKYVFNFRSARVKEITELGVPLIVEVVPVAELEALYQKYRALPATVTLTAPEGLEYGYDTKDAVITATAVAADNLPDGVSYKLEYSWYDTNYNLLAKGEGNTFTLPAGLEPGTYDYHCTVLSTRSDNENKAETNYERVTVTVAPRTAELSWTAPENLTYDGQEKQVTATISNVIADDEVTVELENAVAKDAGKHIVTAKRLLGNASVKYALPAEPAEGSEDPNPREYTLTIEPKPVELTWTDDENLVYDGTAKGTTATATGLIEGDECSVILDQGTAINAGAYTATATGLSNTNYCLPAEVTHGYTIEQRTAELTWTNHEGLVYDGEAKQVTATVSNAVTVGEKTDEVSVTVTGGNEINANTEANPTYTATATALTGADADNYKLPAEPAEGSELPNPRKCLYSIAPETVTLQWTEPESMVYDGNEKTVTATAEGLVKEDKCDVTVENGTAVNADTYTATATALSNPNYCLPEDPTHSFTIEQLTAELTWQNFEGLVYDGQAKNVSAVVSNAITKDGQPDDVTVTVEGGDEIYANNAEKMAYTATAKALAGTAAGNYKLPENAQKQYTIAAKQITVAFENTEARDYDGTASNVTAKAAKDQLIGEDKVNVTVIGGTEKNAGTHTATATALDNPNYTLGDTAVTQDYVIRPLEAQLKWSGDQNLVYNGTAAAVQAEVENLVEGDTAAVTVTDGDKVKAGEYTATATAIGNSNYVLPDDATHAYTIGKLEAVLVWQNDQNLEYDGTAKNVTAVVGNLVGEDKVEVTVTGGTEKDIAEEPYTATATALTGADADNYSLPAEKTHQYTISPRTVEFRWTDAESMVYDGTEKSVTAEIVNLLDGDEGQITLEGNTAVHAGTYTAKVTALEGLTDYRLPEAASYEYTIQPRTLTLTWKAPESLVHDGQPKQVTVTAGNIVDGDEVTVTVTGGTATDIGTYVAKATIEGNTDYALPAEGAEFSYTITADPAVTSVEEQIRALPKTVNLADKATVAAIRTALSALTPAQQAQIAPDLLQRLADAEDQIAAAELEASRAVQEGAWEDANAKYDLKKDGSGKFYAVYKGPAASQATVTVPDTVQVNNESIPVTEIADNAFKGDKKLTTVTIGKNIVRVGKNAFASCAKLKTVKGGANVKIIDNNAFTKDKKLAKLPNFKKLEKLGNNAFKNCIALKKFTIGANIQRIGKAAFSGCKALTALTISSKNLNAKMVASGAFKGMSGKLTVKCPKGKKSSYEEILRKKGLPKSATVK